jgi:uncharacterized cofD-like protein
MAADGSPWAPAFEYRFPAGSGDLEGHALGNLMIAGLANVTGDFTEALDRAAELLRTVGRVLPATAVPVVLKAEVAGQEIVGQVNVSETDGPIARVSITPVDAPVPDEVLEAIAGADQVILGPGSLFTSVLAVASVPRIRRALEARRAGRVYVCNLRPQPPETAGFTDADHLRAVLDHGIPVDVMVAAGPGRETGCPPAERIHGVPVIRSHLACADGSGHEPGTLAAVLSRLT